MATRLTPEQHADLEHHGRKPMQVIDPIDQKVYFIVPGDFFEKFGIPIAYNEAADKDSWIKMKLFFKKVFGK